MGIEDTPRGPVRQNWDWVFEQYVRKGLIPETKITASGSILKLVRNDPGEVVDDTKKGEK